MVPIIVITLNTMQIQERLSQLMNRYIPLSPYHHALVKRPLVENGFEIDTELGKV